MSNHVVNGNHVAENKSEALKVAANNNSAITNGVTKCPFSSNFRPEREEKFVKLKNWETNEYITDKLYKKSLKTVGCNSSRCLGSQMTPNALYRDPRNGKKTKEEMLELATDFIKEHFASFKRKNPEAEKSRLAEVVSSIETTGTFEINEKELIFGAKTAWRNASRCIGRIQWNKLQVMDCRDVKSTAEMFQAICKHLKYATNNGNIRSCISFFPPRDDYKNEFRVWNSQYIRYAAYTQEDGSIVGDPANLEFTELCVKLGWVPKGGRFDVLPLVLQANGKDPDVYEIPPELVLEVPLRHPRFKWFEKLGYKWYAVPAVANIMLDIGGVEFPGAPFNGWFMGTEIGRDLCDVSRYNILPEIAKHMELDTKTSSTLWKDSALVEVNIAILYSFQTDKVTIMDHHVATESFMKHYANELRVRGGCPGDWVWLAPPLSSSATPIFHQEILNYYLNPACIYQPDPWKYHEWEEHLNAPIGGTTKIRFKQLARSVVLSSTLMGKAMANRVKATILYATETEKSHDYAKSLRDIFNHAFDSKVVCMEDYDFSHLEYESLVLVVTSTFGNGDPPGNGEEFAELLVEEANHSHEQHIHHDAKAAKRKQTFTSVSSMAPLSRRSSKLKLGNFTQPDASFSGFLSNVRFSVFGLGSRAYPNFCAFAHAVDTLLGDMGGERLIEIGEGDELCGQEESFRLWAKDVFKVSCKTFCVGENVSAEAASASVAGEDRSWNPKKFKVMNCQGSDDEICSSLSTLRRKKLSELQLVRRENLQHKSSDRSTILVQLSYDDDEIAYRPGDHLGIYPVNQPELVNGLVERLHDSSKFQGVIELQMLEEKSTPIGVISNWNHYKKLPKCTLFNAFYRYLDITSCPSPQLMQIFAWCATDPQQKALLETLGQGEKEYDAWKYNNTPTVLEALQEFSSVDVPSSLLLSQLPPLQCRYYSISSSPDSNPGEVHLTVAVVQYNTKGGKGSLHHGVCSSHLNRVDKYENVIGFIRPARSFHLPDDHTLPCILVGPGTGIAPFRSFWQQRKEMIKKGITCGPMALLFGCRYPDKDNLYEEEISEAVKCGAITEHRIAFSRRPGKPKKYVQNILEEEMSETVIDWIVRRQGHFYVCGDVTMAADVGKTFGRILMKSENKTEDEVTMFVTNLKENGLYHEDIFGITLRVEETNKHARNKTAK